MEKEYICRCNNCMAILTDIETKIQPEPTPKELKVCVIDLEDRDLFGIEVEQSHDISDEDFLKLAQIKNYVYTLEEFQEQMNDCYPIDFEHCFMRFLKV